MDTYGHRLAISRRFGSRIAAGDAVFLVGTEGISELPFTVTDGQRRPLSGMNRLMLLQVLKDQGWSDSRFFTLDQVQQAGWALVSGARPIRLQFLISTGSDGLPLESPSVKQFSVFNAAEILGVPALDKAVSEPVQWLFLAVGQAGFPVAEGDLRGAVCAWMSSLQGEGSLSSSADSLLRVRLAATLLEVQTGLPVASSVDTRLASQWAQGIDNDPISFFNALKDAEKLAAHVLSQVRAVGVEVQVAEDVARSRVLLDGGVGALGAGATAAPGRVDGARAVGGRSGSTLGRVEQMFAERAAVLAVPFAEKDKAKALGAMWYGPQSLWFVPKELDVAAFKEWDVGKQCLNVEVSDALKIDDFQRAMANMGLDTSKSPKPDGKWHNVAVDSYKSGNNKSGSYILSLDGGRDGGAVGTILNKHSGEKFFWRFDGPVLTPEQRAKARAEALVREEIAAAEVARVQDMAAVHADEIWSAGSPADNHGYVMRKGISADGLRQVSGDVLLQYAEFKSEIGTSIVRANQDYLIVPMTNAAGHLRAVQAISSDGVVKSFMRGAQKKGAMLVFGARSFDSLASMGDGAEVAYVEGVATGASFREASGGPVVVCFDAGNLETVVAETFPSLPQGVSCVLAVDNDQFHVERALGFLSDKLGVNPHVAGGQLLDVECGLDDIRQVGLGDVVADGQWQQAARGTYRVTVQRESDRGAVRSIAVDVVPENGERDMRAVFENRGVEAGRVAMQAIGSARAVMVMPEFKSLSGRPTDWNDLAKVEGVAAISAVLRKAGLGLGQMGDVRLVDALSVTGAGAVGRGSETGISR